MAEQKSTADTVTEQPGGVPAPTDDHEHGTRVGYSAHGHRRTVPCTPCCDANSTYKQARKIAAGRVKGVIVPVGLLAALLDGGDPVVLLTKAFGGVVVDAIEIRAAMDRSIR